MATAIGTNMVTALSRRFILPEITDQIYAQIPLAFRLLKQNKRIVRGGTQIEAPLMYQRFAGGGWYSGYDPISVAPSDTIKNGAWDWKQAQVPVAVDGLTLIKTDSPLAVANFLTTQYEQSRMEMAAILAEGFWSNGTTNTKMPEGLEAAVDDGGVAATYGGITRSTNTWWNSTDDSTSTTLAGSTLNSAFLAASKGGRHPSLIVSRVEQYARYWNLNSINQTYPVQPGGHDEILASAGFTNQLFNNVPWMIDDYCFNGSNASNSAVVMLNEDFIRLCVSPRADFYVQPFQTPVGQDAMVSQLFWAGALLVLNCARQAKLSNLSA